jgi:hypothetical protein
LRNDGGISQFAAAMRTLTPLGYTVRLLIAAVAVLGVAWAYVLLMPMGFFPSGYPSWVAKMTLLRQCPANAVEFFGDSRVEAGIVPAEIGAAIDNLGVAGGSAIEVASGVNKLLKCPGNPARVVIALGPERFRPLSRDFWVEALGYGFLGPEELLALERDADRLNDTDTLRAAKTQDGLSGPVRDWLYALRFPSMSFASLVEGQIFRRYNDNEARYARILQARGFVPYPAATPTDKPAPEVSLASFERSPVQVDWFEQTLAALHRRGIPVTLMNMPIKPSTSKALAVEVKRQYYDYLRALAQRFPNIQIVGTTMPVWPNEMFTDEVHLNAGGAQRFSHLLASCFDGAAIRTDCNLDWAANAPPPGQQAGAH